MTDPADWRSGRGPGISRRVLPRRAAAAAALAVLACAPAAAAPEPADAVRYPYVAALSRQTGEERVYFCAGTLVAPQWVLTAAHCFHTRGGARIAPSGLWAVIGRDRLRAADEEAQIGVGRIVVHPGYDPATQAHDLALVRLQDIAGPLIAEAAGPAGDPTGATALGFGSFYEGRLAARALSSTGAPTAQISDRLRQARLRMLQPWDCGQDGRVTDFGTDLCATASPEAACVGDSGGPLVIEAADGPDRLLGVLSSSSGCAVAEPRLGYMRVAAYARWIAETTAQD